MTLFIQESGTEKGSAWPKTKYGVDKKTGGSKDIREGD